MIGGWLKKGKLEWVWVSGIRERERGGGCGGGGGGAVVVLDFWVSEEEEEEEAVSYLDGFVMNGGV